MTLIEKQVRQVPTTGALKSHVVYVPFNEPEGNMFGTQEWSYCSGEQAPAPATHYNPDPVCRHADIAVNGEQARRVLSPTTFHFNDFRDLTVPVTLEEGANTVTFTNGSQSEDQDHQGQRSAHAPVIDRVAVTPLAPDPS